MNDTPAERPLRSARVSDPDPMQLIREAIAGLRFGGIQLTIHEGRLVQIEITEKRRFA